MPGPHNTKLRADDAMRIVIQQANETCSVFSSGAVGGFRIPPQQLLYHVQQSSF